MKKDIILFDINETVLDLSSLSQKFERVFGTKEALPLWFSRLLHTSTVCIATGVQSNFSDLASTALSAISSHYRVILSESDHSELLASFAQLPAHNDVAPALNKLKQHGYRVVAFSNSSRALIAKQMSHSGLIDIFDDIISVEETGSFKPNADVYRYAASRLGCDVNQVRLVATHDWDTHGAMSIGMKAAFIDRSGVPYHPLYLQPDIKGESMGNIADQIIAAN